MRAKNTRANFACKSEVFQIFRAKKNRANLCVRNFTVRIQVIRAKNLRAKFFRASIGLGVVKGPGAC